MSEKSPKEGRRVIASYISEGNRYAQHLYWAWKYPETKMFAGCPIDYWAYADFSKEMEVKND